jgi:hypothetical protein
MCALPGREYRLFRKQYSGKTSSIDFHSKILSVPIFFQL